MASLRAGKSDTTSSTGSSIGTVPEIVRGGYQPVGKIDIAAIRAQAKAAEEYQQRQSRTPPSPQTAKFDAREETYVGTTGYSPVSLPKPKPLVTPPTFQAAPPKPVAPRFGAGAPRFRAGSGGTVAPMPIAPARESKVIGGASKNFAADASGKTPSQLWAERKARERGLSASEQHVIPDVSPATPLPTGPRRADTPPTGYVEDSSDVIGKPVSGGVAAMKERLARQSHEGDAPSLPISPTASRPAAGRRPSLSPPAPSPPTAPSPPPVSMASKPPPKTYASLDDMVAAGVGAGAGVGIGAMASRHQEEDEEPAQETWDTRGQEPVEEDEEDIAARQRSQIIPEPEPEPDHEPEPEPEPVVPPGVGHRNADTGAENAQTAVVLFDYEAQEENEINLTEGQIITEVEIVDEVSPPKPRSLTRYR